MIDGRAGNIDAAFPIATEIFTARVGSRAYDGAKVQAAWVGGNEGFREEHELRTLLGGIFCEGGEFLDGAVAIEYDGRGLYYGYFAFHGDRISFDQLGQAGARQSRAPTRLGGTATVWPMGIGLWGLGGSLRRPGSRLRCDGSRPSRRRGCWGTGRCRCC